MTNASGRELELLCDFGSEEKRYVISKVDRERRLVQPMQAMPPRRFPMTNFDENIFETIIIYVREFKLNGTFNDHMKFSCELRYIF